MALTTKTRDEIIREFQRAYLFRVPGADVGPGTQPYTDACTVADMLLPIYANTPRLLAATKIATSTGSELELDGDAYGIDKPGASFARGPVLVNAGPLGASVTAGMTLTVESTRARFRSEESASVVTGSQINVVALDAGPPGNLKPGTVLKWDSPTPGLHARVTVFENSDGTGLSGGANAADDPEYQRLLLDAKANPAIGGNCATFTQQMMKLPGIGMQAAFAYPAILGPGTTGLAFTMRPQRPGASRLPNGAQIAAVETGLLVNEDDGVLVATVLDQPIALRLAVTWPGSTAGFLDASPWPNRSFAVTVTQVTDALHVRVLAAGAMVAPSVGKTVAFYDAAAARFRRKRIASFTTPFANTYDLTFEGGTDENTSFLPVVGRLLSAGSMYADDVIAPALAHLDRFGPGEQVAVFADEGSRQRRFPAALPGRWPNVLTTQIENDIGDVVTSATVLGPTLPLATTTGVPGVSAYLMRVADIAVTKE